MNLVPRLEAFGIKLMYMTFRY